LRAATLPPVALAMKPVEFSDRTLNVKSPHRFTYVRVVAGQVQCKPGPAKFISMLLL